MEENIYLNKQLKEIITNGQFLAGMYLVVKLQKKH